MAATSTISVTTANEKSNLATIFSKVNKVFFNEGQAITAALLSSSGDGVSCECEFPIIDGSVSFDTGSADVTEVKLTDGTIWTSLASKGDSDISMQVASLNDKIASYFLNKKSAAKLTGIQVFGSDKTFDGEGYNLEVKKATGSLIMTDDTGNSVIILTNVEMYGSLVAGDSDNPAYFNVSITPKANTDGVALYLLQKTDTVVSA